MKQKTLIDDEQTSEPATEAPTKTPSAIDTLRRVLQLLERHGDRDVRRILAFAMEERGIAVCNAVPILPPPDPASVEKLKEELAKLGSQSWRPLPAEPAPAWKPQDGEKFEPRVNRAPEG